MTEERSPAAIRRLIGERYKAAAARVEETTASGESITPPDWSAVDWTDEDGSTLLIEDLVPGTLASWAGYAEVDLTGVPEAAFRGSFACEMPINHAELRPGQTVLDLGCGQGLDLILAARAVGPAGRAIGLDLTPAQVECARRHLAEAGLANAEVREGLMEAIPLEDSSVDWVISNGAINYSPEKPKVFSETFRVLKPGGQMRVADVLIEDANPAVAYRLFGYVHNAGGAVGEAAYVDLMRNAGFVDVAVVSSRVFTAREMLGFAGYDDETAATLPESARQLLVALEGHIATSVFAARKPA